MGRPLNGIEPDPAATDHRNVLAGLHIGGVCHRAKTGDDAAGQQRGAGKGN